MIRISIKKILLDLPLDVRIDMWSLGCFLGELCMGKPLFQGHTRLEVLRNMISILGPLPKFMNIESSLGDLNRESQGISLEGDPNVR